MPQLQCSNLRRIEPGNAIPRHAKRDLIQKEKGQGHVCRRSCIDSDANSKQSHAGEQRHRPQEEHRSPTNLVKENHGWERAQPECNLDASCNEAGCRTRQAHVCLEDNHDVKRNDVDAGELLPKLNQEAEDETACVLDWCLVVEKVLDGELGSFLFKLQRCFHFSLYRQDARIVFVTVLEAGQNCNGLGLESVRIEPPIWWLA